MERVSSHTNLPNIPLFTVVDPDVVTEVVAEAETVVVADMEAELEAVELPVFV